MNRISTVNDKHTPALTPLAVANRRNWSLLRLVQFAVAGIELPAILVAIFEIEMWFHSCTPVLSGSTTGKASLDPSPSPQLSSLAVRIAAVKDWERG